MRFSSVYYKVIWCLRHNSLHQVGWLQHNRWVFVQQKHNSSAAVHCSTQIGVQLETKQYGCTWMHEQWLGTTAAAAHCVRRTG